MTLHNFTLTGQTPLAIDDNMIVIQGVDLSGLIIRAYLPRSIWPSSQADSRALFDRYLVAYDKTTGRRLSGQVRVQGHEYQRWYIEATLSPQEQPTP